MKKLMCALLIIPSFIVESIFAVITFGIYFEFKNYPFTKDLIDEL